MRGRIKAGVRLALFHVLLVAAATTMAWADVAQIKVYKEAFPDEKPKCNGCHVAAMPKKADGKHDLNEYGKKVKAVKTAPDVESYKTVGKIQ